MKGSRLFYEEKVMHATPGFAISRWCQPWRSSWPIASASGAPHSQIWHGHLLNSMVSSASLTWKYTWTLGPTSTPLYEASQQGAEIPTKKQLFLFDVTCRDEINGA